MVPSLSYPEVRASVKLVSSKFVWPGLCKSVKEWAAACIPCQRAKVYKHTKAPLEQFLIPSKCFDDVHVDLVGPLLQSQGFTHRLTIIDCTTRWLEAVPLASTTAAVVAKAFLLTWVSRFGPSRTLPQTEVPSLCQSFGPLWLTDWRLRSTAQLRTTRKPMGCVSGSTGRLRLLFMLP